MFKGFSTKTLRVGGAAALSFTLGLVGCASSSESTDPSNPNQTTNAADLPQVVATSPVLCDLTRQIAQTTIDLTCLIQAGQDPHLYEAKPSDRRAIEDADLVLYGGYGAEPELIRLIEATNTPTPKVAVYEEAVTDPILAEAHDHDHAEATATEAEADHDHAEDDHDHETTVSETPATGSTAVEAETEADHDHAEDATAEGDLAPDPHVWHDAQNGIQIVSVISKQLQQIVPENADQYSQNAQALSEELAQLDVWIKEQVATVPEGDRQLITPHDAFRYYAQAYGFEVEGTLAGLSTEEKPSAAQLTELVDQIKDSGVKAVFAEVTTNPQTIEAIAKDANVTVPEQPLFVEGPGDENSPAPTYQAMLVMNTCTIVNGLGGECLAEDAPV